MASFANTLGRFLAEILAERQISNRALAAQAGVSESVIRNMLKHGIDPKAKDPDAQSLRRIADALGINALYLFQLVGYVPPLPGANTARAEYLADVFDTLPADKQDAVMRVLEVMTDEPIYQSTIEVMRQKSADPLSGMDIAFPALLREAANELIVKYQMLREEDMAQIKPDTQVLERYTWQKLPTEIRQRILALIRYKLSVNYDPTMVNPEWRQ